MAKMIIFIPRVPVLIGSLSQSAGQELVEVSGSPGEQLSNFITPLPEAEKFVKGHPGAAIVQRGKERE